MHTKCYLCLAECRNQKQTARHKLLANGRLIAASKKRSRRKNQVSPVLASSQRTLLLLFHRVNVAVASVVASHDDLAFVIVPGGRSVKPQLR